MRVSKETEANQRALDDPQPGDYWHEMFCPYFLVVHVAGTEITILSCLGGPQSHSRKHEPNARIDFPDGSWSFDYSRHMVVDRAWMEHTVRYSSFDGFVADVAPARHVDVVDEWRDFQQKAMREKISQLEKEWEDFTGWTYVKQEQDS